MAVLRPVPIEPVTKILYPLLFRPMPNSRALVARGWPMMAIVGSRSAVDSNGNPDGSHTRRRLSGERGFTFPSIQLLFVTSVWGLTANDTAPSGEWQESCWSVPPVVVAFIERSDIHK